MDNEKKGIWQIRIATLCVFILGAIAGVVGMYSYQAWHAGKQPSRRERFQETFNRLGLNDPQKSEVQQIIGDMREKLSQLRKDSEPKVQEIRNETDQRLQKVMTPEQWQQFQQEREKIRQPDRSSHRTSAEKESVQ